MSDETDLRPQWVGVKDNELFLLLNACWDADPDDVDRQLVAADALEKRNDPRTLWLRGACQLWKQCRDLSPTGSWSEKECAQEVQNLCETDAGARITRLWVCLLIWHTPQPTGSGNIGLSWSNPGIRLVQRWCWFHSVGLMRAQQKNVIRDTFSDFARNDENPLNSACSSQLHFSGVEDRESVSNLHGLAELLADYVGTLAREAKLDESQAQIKFWGYAKATLDQCKTMAAAQLPDISSYFTAPTFALSELPQADAQKWPPCFQKLEDPQSPIVHADLSQFLFRDGIERSMPIAAIRRLGTCSTAAYMDCPTTPEHVFEHVEDGIEEYGGYEWTDFDLCPPTGEDMLELRMVFNYGDTDCNDGLWGIVWDRKTAEMIATIKSVGDMETSVEVISQEAINLFDPLELDLFQITEEDDLEGMDTYCRNDAKLEQLIALVLGVVSHSEMRFARGADSDWLDDDSDHDDDDEDEDEND